MPHLDENRTARHAEREAKCIAHPQLMAKQHAREKVGENRVHRSDEYTRSPRETGF